MNVKSSIFGCLIGLSQSLKFMFDMETAKETQALIAHEISLKSELQKRSEELKLSLLSSEIIHKNDLLNFSIRKASNAEEQLEISREQIKTLEGQLSSANRDLESCWQEVDACCKEIVTLEGEVWKLTFNK